MPSARLGSFAAILCLGVAWHAASAQSGAGRVIRGTVYDSLDNRPLAAAQVTLLDRADSTAPTRSVVADSRGQFRFTGVPGGVYLIGFDAPLLDSLRITVAPRQIQLAILGSDPLEVGLAVPGPRTVHDAFCQRSSTVDSTSVLIGYLADASTRGVVANGVVKAQWLTVQHAGKRLSEGWKTDSTRAGADGSYVLCGLPPGTEVTVVAATDRDESGVVPIATPNTTGVVRRDLFLVNGTAPRDGVITGIVESDSGKTPIAHAQIHIEGDSATATTGSDGQFTLRHLPYGTLAVAVRRLGYLPQERAVDVLAAAPGRAIFTMERSATVLDAVRTMADPTGFDQRRAAGWGRYFDAADIARINPFDVTDIVRWTPGVHATGVGFHAQIQMRALFGGRCVPSYYLDGKRLSGVSEAEDLDTYVNPKDLRGVEVYASVTDTPLQFRDLLQTCGSIVMWSR